MNLVASAEDDLLAWLADRAGLEPSTLSRTLENLARKPWVEIGSIGQDRRRRAVWLTEAAVRLLARAISLWQRVRAKIARANEAEETESHRDAL